ncbi:MAG: cytochrome c [Candidatus Acidiferrales bacterium]
MMHSKSCRMNAGIVLGSALLTLVGCSKTETKFPESNQTRPHGRALYQMYCQGCHDEKHPEFVKQPPELAGIFQRSRLPSGAPATDEAVRKTIMEGRGIMPSFQQTLSKEDIDDLVRYLHAKDGHGLQAGGTAGREIPSQ